jgi:hypothetical protein
MRKLSGRCQLGGRRFAVVVLAVMGLGGCGGSSPVHRGSASVLCGGAVRLPFEVPLASSEHEGPNRCLGDAYTLAFDQVPEGAEFAIIGQRYTRAGHDYLSLTIEFMSPGEVEVGGGGSGDTEVLESNNEEGCEVKPFGIFYGVLTKPGDSVVLRDHRKKFRTREVDLPAVLDTSGVLVYGTTTGSRLGVELDGKLVGESYARPGPCFAWGRQRAHRACLLKLTAATDRCLRRGGFTLRPPQHATPYLAARRECSMEAARA